MNKKHNSIANTLESRLFCIKKFVTSESVDAVEIHILVY